MKTLPSLPIRPRRLRQNRTMRAMVRETILTPSDFISPIFVTHGENIKSEISSMPGVFQHSVDTAVLEAQAVADLGIPAVILFGIPASKDPIGEENFATEGIIPQAIRAIKAAVPDLLVISDICMCEYTDHGHCGVLNHEHSHLPEGYVLNDESLKVHAQAAIVHAQAGADIIAPSSMLDGIVATLRIALDEADFQHIPIMSYAIKYASAFYGPFRDAADGAPKFGDRKTHQMDPANAQEALREAELDVAEGADFLMVKPALSYLDVIQRAKAAFPQLPMVCYNVSGEYAMVKAAAQNGWLDEQKIVIEKLTSMKRAGADVIITYHAKDAATWLSNRN